MCDDPNGTRWSKSEKNIGKSLLQRSGWTEGSGLGKNQEGVTSHVKTRRKDGVMGVGYEGGVQETWSTQSVGFADVLSRIKSAVNTDSPDSDKKRNKNSNDSNSGSDDEGENSDNNNNNNKNGGSNGGGPSGGRHVCMYAKRHALKTELLRSKGGVSSEEILGSASSKRGRGGDGDEAHEEDAALLSTLRSPLLQRLMMRVPTLEPKRTTTDVRETVRITKPTPRPPKVTDTPFLVAPQQ
ncbi:Pin2-interacting protein X1 [Trypanosoma grayi]|uniref:Pin2-interacting protein X1 n=1 Tax=Trypanosoma grayi TaxID=71804 RepID=UPI0004F46E16|nr:Pin2-interacting protein X1 [Trypanosoma grayi]KEG05786.1 Pin2-interacting protein X1 [Trypanosoma grayi]